MRPSVPPPDPTGEPSPWARPTAPDEPSTIVYPPAPPYAPVPPYPPPPPYPPVPPYPPPPYPGSPAYPPAYMPSPPSGRRSSRGLLVGIAVGLLLLAAIGVGPGQLRDRSREDSASSSPAAGAGQVHPIPNPFGTGGPFGLGTDPFGTGDPFGLGLGAQPTLDPGQAATGLPLGSSVHVFDPDGKWTVTVESAAWRTTGCDGSAPLGRLLVATVRVAVDEGAALINPLAFSYTGPDGQPGLPGMFEGCAPSLLPFDNLQQGAKISGTVTFDVIGEGGGSIGYGTPFQPIATWVAPA